MRDLDKEIREAKRGVIFVFGGWWLLIIFNILLAIGVLHE